MSAHAWAFVIAFAVIAVVGAFCLLSMFLSGENGENQ